MLLIPPQSDCALFADLDGTVLATDSLYECLLSVLKNRFWLALLVPFWALRGRAFFKYKVAGYSIIDFSLLPYRSKVVAYLKTEKAKGRKIILATGATQIIANQVAENLKLFDFILASDKYTNNVGENKLKAIVSLNEGLEFEYIGDSTEDFPVLRSAAIATIVDRNNGLVNKLKKAKKKYTVVESVGFNWVAFLRLIRAHQWSKNLLIFSPIVAAQKFSEISWAPVFFLFIGFCALASAVYIFNDLMDIDSDRAHYNKRYRPLAAGEFAIKAGWLTLFLGLIIAFSVAASISSQVVLLFLVYATANILYSILLKQLILVDVFILTSFYLARIIAGSLASSIELTSWFLSFAVLTFLSLALLKRYTEIIEVGSFNDVLPGRGYRYIHAKPVLALGVISGLLSCLVLVMYMNSASILNIYERPFLLWLLCPCHLFWFTRMWILAVQRKMDEDPVRFAVKDPITYFLSGLIILLLALAS